MTLNIKLYGRVAHTTPAFTKKDRVYRIFSCPAEITTISRPNQNTQQDLYFKINAREKKQKRIVVQRKDTFTNFSICL